MAEVIENEEHMEHTEHKEYASKATGNSALTLGIIGTALGGLAALGGFNGIGGGNGLFGNLFNGNQALSAANVAATAATAAAMNESNNNYTMTNQDLYIERKQCKDYLDMTVSWYENEKAKQKDIDQQFFNAYQRDIDNSFNLYKYNRDTKDELNSKIDALSGKIDVMAAVRPYQDALINSKIDTNALMAQYNLDKRTCRMIQGVVTLPSSPTVTGMPSYPLGYYYSGTPSSGATA